MSAIAVFGALVALGLDIVATAVIWRSKAFASRQKQLQTILIWLVPALGALSVLAFALYILKEPESVPRSGDSAVPTDHSWALWSASSGNDPSMGGPTIRGDS